MADQGKKPAVLIVGGLGAYSLVLYLYTWPSESD